MNTANISNEDTAENSAPTQKTEVACGDTLTTAV